MSRPRQCERSGQASGVHSAGAKPEAILIGAFALEGHLLAARQRSVAVHLEGAEVNPATPRRLRRVENSPALFGVPHPHDSGDHHGRLQEPRRGRGVLFRPLATVLRRSLPRTASGSKGSDEPSRRVGSHGSEPDGQSAATATGSRAWGAPLDPGAVRPFDRLHPASIPASPRSPGRRDLIRTTPSPATSRSARTARHTWGPSVPRRPMSSMRMRSLPRRHSARASAPSRTAITQPDALQEDRHKVTNVDVALAQHNHAGPDRSYSRLGHPGLSTPRAE
jgi:hypothetical protein